MGFFLWQVSLGSTPKVEIEIPDYDEILRTWNDLALIAEIEEAWDSVIQNYVEFETDLLNSDVHSIIRPHDPYHDLQDSRLVFSRRLCNLFQTFHSYLDHTTYHLGKLQSKGPKDIFAAETTQMYDSDISYRFMEELRQYSQYRGIAMYSVLFGSHWIESDIEQERRLRPTTIGHVDKFRIQKPFKATVMPEKEPGKDALDVTALVREYVEGLGAVHAKLRAAYRADLDYCKAVIRSAIERYAAENAGNVQRLAAAKFSSDGNLLEYQYIFEDLPERIESLVRRNGSLVNLRRRFAKGQLIEQKPLPRRR